MKTTLELPNDLVREVKVLAAQEQLKLKDLVADLLRRGLAARVMPDRKPRKPMKLPLIQCRHAAAFSPEQVSELLLRQEMEWAHDPSGH
jgi:hypothetical protein